MLKQEYADLSIFHGLTIKQLNELYGMMELRRFAQGVDIFVQGDLARHLFILLCGEVVIEYKPYDGPTLVVARIEPGGVFGWSAALGRDVYTSGARAVQPVESLQISIEDLRSLCELHPEIGSILLDRLAGGIAERLRNTHDHILSILSQGIEFKNDCSQRGEK